MITLEMLGLTAATKPLNHALIHERFNYEGYRGIGRNAFAYLDLYQTAKLERVFIVTEAPDNTGTSITNRAEVVAMTIEMRLKFGQSFAGDDHRPNSKMIYIEHYPRSKSRSNNAKENFSLVTFMLEGRQYSDPNWTHLDRSEVERLIGQPFAPDRNYNEQ